MLELRRCCTSAFGHCMGGCTASLQPTTHSKSAAAFAVVISKVCTYGSHSSEPSSCHPPSLSSSSSSFSSDADSEATGAGGIGCSCLPALRWRLTTPPLPAMAASSIATSCSCERSSFRRLTGRRRFPCVTARRLSRASNDGAFAAGVAAGSASALAPTSLSSAAAAPSSSAAASAIAARSAAFTNWPLTRGRDSARRLRDS
mmetsp:Transcript_43470/g.130403  ORF Transcript_43470/g.130403 Transcript_43470/m.130403 type:complete len:202 (+) Transcript_43470:479-1084(+)